MSDIKRSLIMEKVTLDVLNKKIMVYGCGEKHIDSQPKEFASIKQMLSHYNPQKLNISLQMMGNSNGK